MRKHIQDTLKNSHVRTIINLAKKEPNINPFSNPTLVDISRNYNSKDSKEVFRLYKRITSMSKVDTSVLL